MIAQFSCFVMKNYDVVEQPTILENLTMRFTDEAVNFVRANKDNPFLLYMSYAKVHTALFNTRPFVNHSIHGHYGDNVEEMDWSVGQIVTSVEELGLKDDTFVYFTSDNGPHLEEIDTQTGEYHGGWKGIYKGGKPWISGTSHTNNTNNGKEKSEGTSPCDCFPSIQTSHVDST